MPATRELTMKTIAADARVDLLVLDDWGPEQLNAEQRRYLLNNPQTTLSTVTVNMNASIKPVGYNLQKMMRLIFCPTSHPCSHITGPEYINRLLIRCDCLFGDIFSPIELATIPPSLPAQPRR